MDIGDKITKNIHLAENGLAMATVNGYARSWTPGI